MRRLVIILVLFLVNAVVVKSQQIDKYLVDMSDYQHIVGVVFEDTYQGVGFIEGLNSRFTPQFMDLVKAEDTIIEFCTRNNKSHFICREIDNFKHFRRQYVGRINAKGEKVLEIQFLNFKDQRAKENFEGWEEGYLIAAGSFYEKNTFMILVNLHTQIIE